MLPDYYGYRSHPLVLTAVVNIGDFGEIDKIGNFGNILPISSN